MVDAPGQLPGPPSDLSSRQLVIQEFQGSLYRTHPINLSPVFFGRRCIHRFDAPDQSFGVLYAGADAFCAFVETFGKAAGTSIVTTTALEERSLSELRPTRPLRLIDLTEPGSLVRIGADARLFAGDHDIARLWAKALHSHPISADGLIYPSRLDPPRKAVALFEDRAPKLTEWERQSWYAPGAQRHLLAKIMEHYRFELIETRYVAHRKPAVSVQPGLFEE